MNGRGSRALRVVVAPSMMMRMMSERRNHHAQIITSRQLHAQSRRRHNSRQTLIRHEGRWQAEDATNTDSDRTISSANDEQQTLTDSRSSMKRFKQGRWIKAGARFSNPGVNATRFRTNDCSMDHDYNNRHNHLMFNDNESENPEWHAIFSKNPTDDEKNQEEELSSVEQFSSWEHYSTDDWQHFSHDDPALLLKRHASSHKQHQYFNVDTTASTSPTITATGLSILSVTSLDVMHMLKELDDTVACATMETANHHLKSHHSPTQCVGIYETETAASTFVSSDDCALSTTLSRNVESNVTEPEALAFSSFDAYAPSSRHVESHNHNHHRRLHNHHNTADKVSINPHHIDNKTFMSVNSAFETPAVRSIDRSPVSLQPNQSHKQLHQQQQNQQRKQQYQHQQRHQSIFKHNSREASLVQTSSRPLRRRQPRGSNLERDIASTIIRTERESNAMTSGMDLLQDILRDPVLGVELIQELLSESVEADLEPFAAAAAQLTWKTNLCGRVDGADDSNTLFILRDLLQTYTILDQEKKSCTKSGSDEIQEVKTTEYVVMKARPSLTSPPYTCRSTTRKERLQTIFASQLRPIRFESLQLCKSDTNDDNSDEISKEDDTNIISIRSESLRALTNGTDGESGSDFLQDVNESVQSNKSESLPVFAGIDFEDSIIAIQVEINGFHPVQSEFPRVSSSFDHDDCKSLVQGTDNDNDSDEDDEDDEDEEAVEEEVVVVVPTIEPPEAMLSVERQNSQLEEESFTANVADDPDPDARIISMKSTIDDQEEDNKVATAGLAADKSTECDDFNNNNKGFEKNVQEMTVNCKESSIPSLDDLQEWTVFQANPFALKGEVTDNTYFDTSVETKQKPFDLHISEASFLERKNALTKYNSLSSMSHFTMIRPWKSSELGWKNA